MVFIPPSLPPFPGDRNPKREGLTNWLRFLLQKVQSCWLISFALIVQLRISAKFSKIKRKALFNIYFLVFMFAPATQTANARSVTFGCISVQIKYKKGGHPLMSASAVFINDRIITFASIYQRQQLLCARLQELSPRGWHHSWHRLQGIRFRGGQHVRDEGIPLPIARFQP